MGFFDGLPPPPPVPDEPPPRPRPVWERPEDVLGGVVTQQMLLARNAKAAIAVGGITAFPTGFDFALAIVLRDEDRYGRFWRDGFHRSGPPDEPVPDELIRLGIRFADGTAVTNLGRGFPDYEAEPSGPILMASGGGGGGRHFSQRYWVWPLPPAGPMSFFCAWPALDIPETRVDLDARLILDAAPRAVRLWPAEE